MFKASWMTISITGMLLSAAGFADDAPLPVVTLSPAALPAELGVPPRWQLTQTIEPVSYSDHWSEPIEQLDFQDPGAFARFSKVRELSLLTLAEVGKTRLFLGVNEEGLVGLHFRAFPRYGKERYLEVIRMPYLEDTQPGTEAE